MYDEHHEFQIDCHQKDKKHQYQCFTQLFPCVISLIHLSLFLPRVLNSILCYKIKFLCVFYPEITFAILVVWDVTITHKHKFNNNEIISDITKSCRYSINSSHQHKSFVVLKYTMNLDLWFDDKTVGR